MNKKVIKSLVFQKKYIFLIIFVSTVFSILFSAYLMANESREENRIIHAKNSYGDFQCAFFNVTEGQYDMIKEILDIKKLTEIKNSSFKIKEKIVQVNYLNELDIKNTYYYLVEGSFPKTEDEIVVEKSYLQELGYTSDEMLGAEIEIYNYTKELTEVKKVTGLVCIKKGYISSYDGQESSPIILANKDYYNPSKFDYLSIFITLKDTEDLLNEMQKVLQEINENEEVNNIQCAVNDELIYAEGNNFYAKQEKYKEIRIYVIIMATIILFVCFTVNNIINICVTKWNDCIKIYKLLGMNMNELVSCITLIMCISILAGGILGNIIGYLFLRLTGYLSIDMFMENVSTVIIIPWEILLIQLILECFFASILLMNKLKVLKKNTAETILNSKSGMLREKDSLHSYKVIFQTKQLNRFKYATRNCFFYKRRKIGAVLCIIVAILLTNFLNYQHKLEDYDLVDNNYDYKYFIDVKDYFKSIQEGKKDKVIKSYNEIVDLCETYNCMPNYYMTVLIDDFKLDKKLISDEYLQRLKMDVVHMQEIAGSNQITVKVALMGYSDEMIRELFKQNGIEKEQLEDGEGLMLTRTVNRDNTGSFKINSSIGKDYEFYTYYQDNNNKIKINICDMIDHISLYPKAQGNYPCIIINQNTYRNNYLKDYVTPFYLYDPPKQLVFEIERRIQGTDFLKMIKQDDEIYNARKSRQLLNAMYSTIIVTFYIVIFINIVTMMIYELELRKRDFNILSLLGINKRQQFISFIIENAIVYSIGFLGAMTIIHTLIDKLNILNIDYTGMIFITICFVINNIYSYIRLRNMKHI